LLIVSLAAVLLLLNCKKSILVAESKTETVFNKRLVTITTDNVQNPNLLYNEQGRLLVHTTGNTVYYYKPGSDHYLTQLNKGSG
jgi:hypothetical protein